jgi:hypothetical protein
VTDQMPAPDEGTTTTPRSRRQLLTLAGAGAAAGTAALVLGTASQAGAAQGGSLLIGESNTGTDLTSLTTSGLNGAAFTVSVIETGDNEAAGIAGMGNDASDVKCAGTGRLGQLAVLTDGPSPSWSPNTTAGGTVYHELVRSDAGVLWASRGAEGDTANRWKRINAVRVDDAAGTGDVFVPVRVYDSRTGSGDPIPATEETQIVVADTNGIPADAVAVFGNLTAVAPGSGGFASGGYLTLFPYGSIMPTVSNVNPAPTGQHAFPNFFFCAVGGEQSLFVYNSVETHIVIDIFAYVQ